ncbi:ABC-type metal ion transporter, periplasmic subunit [Thalassoporum mexicanum PCC 7367]|uniref:metal ABC transporter solute-binding protein, Zn/Mn family n=1 Tax=Thalassoporum mexicanum TaxID=3457544 RepID=UPI00029FFECF|nr:zinc ABC transporter substrate-binding protein [Pseudanabaena sp. PCC 7367]AFY71597.1 ABC-type metal ion transporter, periplasmic subunit [Pseudanabaena sp. PCC 7367]
MKKIKILPRQSRCAIAALLLSLVGCTSAPSTSEQSSPVDIGSNAEQLQVVTTILPITQFTKAVAGDRTEVISLIPSNTSPHDYQAKPDDVIKLAQADVLVQNGLEMEAFLDDMVANAENPDLIIIDTSEGIPTIASADIEEEHDEHQEDNKEHNHADEHDEHDEHDQEEHAGHHSHGEHNPHVWLDPKRAIMQVENIRDGLIAIDPAGAEEYEENAAAYIAELQALDAEIATQLAPYAGQTFVAYHDFAPYFADSYGLAAEFLVDTPEENPSPEDVKNVIDVVAESNLKTLLAEPQIGESAFAALAKDLDLQVSIFDPLETGTEAAMEPDYYFTIMRQNAANLEAAFGGGAISWQAPWLFSLYPISIPSLVLVTGVAS